VNAKERNPARSKRASPDAAHRLAEAGGDALRRLVHGAADITLVLDGAGVIVEASFRDSALQANGGAGWPGLTWAETVTTETQDKVMEMLRDARAAPDAPTRWRQVNHRLADGSDVSVEYSVVLLSDDARLASRRRLVAIGRDQRPLMTMQRRLVEAQQSVERDYWRFREAETRYRKLFQTAPEAVLIVEGSGNKVLEANPAAESLVQVAGGKLVGAPLPSLFDVGSAVAVQALLASARTLGKHQPLSVRLTGGETVAVLATFVLQDEASFTIVRLVPQVQELLAERDDDEADSGAARAGGTAEMRQRRNGRAANTGGRDGASLAGVGLATRSADPLFALPAAYLNASADALAFTDAQGRVLSVNRAFANLAQLASVDEAAGQPLDRWLGRPGVELEMLLGNLRQSGSVGLYSTTLRGEFGARSDVEIAAAKLAGAAAGTYAFALRDVGRRIRPTGLKNVPSTSPSAEQLTELVGRVPLKQIVAETSDLIEQLSIQTALEMSQDNRALAAQLLGLSRQSLYVKLRRYGLGDLPEGDDA
jgi:PAS domain-containing protein